MTLHWLGSARGQGGTRHAGQGSQARGQRAGATCRTDAACSLRPEALADGAWHSDLPAAPGNEPAERAALSRPGGRGGVCTPGAGPSPSLKAIPGLGRDGSRGGFCLCLLLGGFVSHGR